MRHDDDSASDDDGFSRGARGKYAGRMGARPLRVTIDKELAKAFPTERAVNDALRELLRQRASETRRTPD